MRLLSVTIVAAGLALVASHVPAEAQDAAKGRRDRNRITAEEIQTASADNLYELVEALRPQWLRTRGRNTFQTRPGWDELSRQPAELMARLEIIVYVNGVRHGPQNSLRAIKTQHASALEFLDAPSATQRLGTGHEHGAILVLLRQ